MTSERKETISEHEIKYIVNNNRSHQIIKWLKHCCVPDKKHPAGYVSSIYYDTRDWNYISEKINSDFLKTKIRIRWYSDLHNKKESDYSFVEAKFKIGSTRKKIRVKVPYNGKLLNSIRLEDNRLLEIPNVLRTVDVHLKKQLFPVFQIGYKRMRFLDSYTGSRICLDYDISSPRVNPYMMPKKNPFMLPNAVFEIKGMSLDLPASLQPLLFMGFRKSSFSKYQECYQKIMQIQF